MRILMVNRYARITGGFDRICIDLSAALRARGHEVAYLSTASDHNVEREGAFIPTSFAAGARTELSLRQAPAAAASAIWNPHAAEATRSLLRDFAPAVVHSNKLYPHLSVAPVVVAARRGFPVVQAVADYELISASPLDHRGGRIDTQADRIAQRGLNTATLPVRRWFHARHVRAWNSCSRFVADAYAAHGIQSRVIPLPSFNPIQATAPPGFEQRKGIVFSGRVSTEKGVLDVLQLARDSPELPVTVAGYGPLMGAVDREARRLPNLTATGWLEPARVLELLQTARVAVMPSRWQEPGGLAALDAMSAGTPVVAYRVGGLAEYVAESGAGCVLAPDANLLRNACLELHDDEETWRRLSANGLAAVRGSHALERYVGCVEELYEEAAR